MKKALCDWFLTLVTLAAILWLTLAPDPLPDEMDIPLFPGADKVVHGLMMAGLVWAACLDLMRKDRSLPHWRRLRSMTVGVIVVLVCLFGGGIELVQKAMAMGRGADPLDFAADAAGAAVAGVIVLALPWPRQQRRPKFGQTGREPQ